MKRVSNINADQYGEKASVFSLQKGKLPPQAVDLEEVVLGAMMIDKKGVDEVIDILNPEAFYSESHNLILTAMVKLFEETKPIDLLTVSSQLKKDRMNRLILIACHINGLKIFIMNELIPGKTLGQFNPLINQTKNSFFYPFLNKH